MELSCKCLIVKVNNRNTRKRCEIFSKLTIKTPERRHGRRSGFFIVLFGPISHLFSGIAIDDLEQVNVFLVIVNIFE